MSLLHLSIPNPPRQLSFSSTLIPSNHLFPRNQLSLHSQPNRTTIRIIRMGGGPRTFPGGVSKWQWKRMQAKKAKQLLKARLTRERQIYEMRKRTELKAAVSELERPWEVVERAPNLFSVRADEQLKVLADRFQRPGGFDMWSEKDGPQLFDHVDELPSARFFPKGVVHSVKPYRKITDDLDDWNSSSALASGFANGEENSMELSTTNSKDGTGKVRRGKLRKQENTSTFSSMDSNGLGSRKVNLGTEQIAQGGPRQSVGNRQIRKGNGLEKGSGNFGFDTEQKEERVLRQDVNRRIRSGNGLEKGSGNYGFDTEQKGGRVSSRRIRKGNGLEKLKHTDGDVYDMSLLQDGSYGF